MFGLFKIGAYRSYSVTEVAKIAKGGWLPLSYLHNILFDHSNRLGNLRHHGAFDPFAEHVTTKLVRLVDRAYHMQGIGRAAAVQ
ncbi:protein of unknown function [Paenibacillus alvei]|uniref:Uncharacterized protein n=1 Tax=Paenibacillus alvei TaxID=44250 RepID=A0A383R3G0_PAEAL|nr:protein of unknown function [Paenibacillus alvei]